MTQTARVYDLTTKYYSSNEYSNITLYLMLLNSDDFSFCKLGENLLKMNAFVKCVANTIIYIKSILYSTIS